MTIKLQLPDAVYASLLKGNARVQGTIALVSPREGNFNVHAIGVLACGNALVYEHLCRMYSVLVKIYAQRQSKVLGTHRYPSVGQFAELASRGGSFSAMHIEVTLSGRYQGYGALHSGVALH